MASALPSSTVTPANDGSASHLRAIFSAAGLGACTGVVHGDTAGAGTGSA